MYSFSFYEPRQNAKAMANPATEDMTVVLTPRTEAALAWVVAAAGAIVASVTPSSVLQASPLRAVAFSRKVMSAHCCHRQHFASLR